MRIGQTYTFDQTDPRNWYHAVGFAYYPNEAHGETWGADERDEVEGHCELLYKTNGATTTCPDAGDTGLDCYEHQACGTFDVAIFAGGGAKQCNERFLCGNLDTTFEKCMQAIDCKMKEEMLSHTAMDSHNKVAVFMQQMIPHHANAVDMAKILLAQVDAAAIDSAIEEGGLSDMLSDIINVQNFQIHQFRNHLSSFGMLPDMTTTTAVEDVRTSGQQRGQIFSVLFFAWSCGLWFLEIGSHNSRF